MVQEFLQKRQFLMPSIPSESKKEEQNRARRSQTGEESLEKINVLLRLPLSKIRVWQLQNRKKINKTLRKEKENKIFLAFVISFLKHCNRNNPWKSVSFIESRFINVKVVSKVMSPYDVGS